MKIRNMISYCKMMIGISMMIFSLIGCNNLENQNTVGHVTTEHFQNSEFQNSEFQNSEIEEQEDIKIIMPLEQEATKLSTQPEPKEGFTMVDVITTKGVCYEYCVYEMQNVQLEYYFEIVVLENGEELQVIRQEQQEYASLKPAIDTLISERDVDFDGNQDILIHSGNFGAQGAIMYACYRKEGERFVELPAFSEIANPLIATERHLIQGSSRSSAAVYVYDMYEFIEGELVNSHRLTMDYESQIATEEEFLNQEWVVINEYTDWDEEIYGEDTYWSIYADYWEI